MTDGINRKTGDVNLYILCPMAGDSLFIVNRGSHFEVRHYHWSEVPLYLTDEDIKLLRMGEIVWH